jgi:eukaryotic-like serine/threonine-protein kinase
MDSETNDTLVAGSSGSERRHYDGEPLVLDRGATVGRYVVLTRLGAGAMGVVYAAYDPELDRRVAIKLLEHTLAEAGATYSGGGSRGGRPAGAGHNRLLREAQALAKLSHPNVVAVHDVGEHEGRVFIAMELVAGRTLRAWLSEEKPRWQEVLDVHVRAGRGLAAAHAFDMVHRDFKPDNVMLGDDGRVRVMDFGLARTRETADGVDASELPSHEPGGDGSWAPNSAMVGTPAYMAPELLEGTHPPEATADQFAFCVSLWEALYAQRPFRGSTIMELATNVLEGKLVAPPASAKVPRWVRRVLQRGLAIDPRQRWPSMAALLEALSSGRRRARWRKASLAVAALGVLATTAFGWAQYDERRRLTGCELDGAQLDALWNDETRATLAAALIAAGPGHAEKTAHKVMPWLDAHAQAWKEARTQSCLDLEIRGAWDAETAARGFWCLDERRAELAALVHELSQGEALAVDNAVLSAANLRSVEICRDVDVLSRLPSPPTGRLRDDVQDVRSELARARALQGTGAYEKALETARSALRSAEQVSWPPLLVDARYLVGALLEHTGEYEASERELERAYFEAATSGMTDGAAEVAEQLAVVTAQRLARYDSGLLWSRHAEVHLSTLPDVAGTRQAAHLNNRALVYRAAGRSADAKPLFEHALALREASLGVNHPGVAAVLSNLAHAQFAEGAHAEARASLERAVAIHEETLGPEHPRVAASQENLANVLAAMGEYELAQAGFERALGIRERSLGPNHPDIAQTVANLAMIHYHRDALEEAKSGLKRALAVQERVFGSEHPTVALTLVNLANVHREAGANEDAERLYERALSIREAVFGPTHPEVAHVLDNLGVIRRELGRPRDAVALHERALAVRQEVLGLEHRTVAESLFNLGATHLVMDATDDAETAFDRALQIWTQAWGPDHPMVAGALIGLARVALRRERHADAIAPAERALKVLASSGAGPMSVAEARFVLARALSYDPSSRTRAVALAEQARDAYRAATPSHEREIADVERLLDALTH